MLKENQKTVIAPMFNIELEFSLLYEQSDTFVKQNIHLLLSL